METSKKGFMKNPVTSGFGANTTGFGSSSGFPPTPVIGDTAIDLSKPIYSPAV